MVQLEHHASGLELLARLPERSGGGGEEAAESSGWPRREFDDVDDAALCEVCKLGEVSWKGERLCNVEGHTL